jgi:uncharacterized protein (TIGR02145 family)
MSDNTWGFSLNTTDFYSIPAHGTPTSIKRTEVPMTAEYERTPVNFGAKVGMDLTAGTYEDSVVFTAYVNGQDVPSNEMQGFNCSNAMSVGETKTLTDTRDQEEYTVHKFADNRCWMTQNLRIADTTVTSEKSDMPSGSFTLPASNWVWHGTEGPKREDPYIYINSYGAYYNYVALSAGTATGDNGSATDFEDSLSASICPKGWKVPSQAEWQAFLAAEEIPEGSSSENATKLKAEPYNFVQSSWLNYTSTSPSGAGFDGAWWSDTPSPTRWYRYYMYVDSSYVSTTDHALRAAGLPVRCVTRQ